MPSLTLTLGLFVFALTLLICYGILKKAHTLGLIDRPNERSSHKVPTPRGAGVSFFIAISIASLFLILQEGRFLFLPYLLVPMGMATLGFLDDFLNLSARLKFAIQFFIALAFSTTLFFFEPTLSFLNIGLSFFYIPFIMWLTNLFNFMDGVDGIAGTQGLVSAGAFAFFLQPSPEAFSFSLFLGLGCLAFLFFNWHPAKVFMGDVGSCFIGGGLAALAIYSQEQTMTTVVTAAFFVGPFIVDATYTLLIRGFTGQKVMSAHRLHLYQKLVNEKAYKASTISCLYLIMSLFVFIPLAWLTQTAPWWLQMVTFFVAATPLLALAYVFKAGRLETSN